MEITIYYFIEMFRESLVDNSLVTLVVSDVTKITISLVLQRYMTTLPGGCFKVFSTVGLKYVIVPQLQIWFCFETAVNIHSVSYHLNLYGKIQFVDTKKTNTK